MGVLKNSGRFWRLLYRALYPDKNEPVAVKYRFLILILEIWLYPTWRSHELELVGGQKKNIKQRNYDIFSIALIRIQMNMW